MRIIFLIRPFQRHFLQLVIRNYEVLPPDQQRNVTYTLILGAVLLIGAGRIHGARSIIVSILLGLSCMLNPAAFVTAVTTAPQAIHGLLYAFYRLMTSTHMGEHSHAIQSILHHLNQLNESVFFGSTQLNLRSNFNELSALNSPRDQDSRRPQLPSTVRELSGAHHIISNSAGRLPDTQRRTHNSQEGAVVPPHSAHNFAISHVNQMRDNRDSKRTKSTVERKPTPGGNKQKCIECSMARLPYCRHIN